MSAINSIFRWSLTPLILVFSLFAAPVAWAGCGPSTLRDHVFINEFFFDANLFLEVYVDDLARWGDLSAYSVVIYREVDDPAKINDQPLVIPLGSFTNTVPGGDQHFHYYVPTADEKLYFSAKSNVVIGIVSNPTGKEVLIDNEVDLLRVGSPTIPVYYSTNCSSFTSTTDIYHNISITGSLAAKNVSRIADGGPWYLMPGTGINTGDSQGTSNVTALGLLFTATASPSSTTVNSNSRVTLTVTNGSTGSAAITYNGASVAIALGTGLSQTGGQISPWSVGNLASGTSASTWLDVTASIAGTYYVTATLTFQYTGSANAQSIAISTSVPITFTNVAVGSFNAFESTTAANAIAGSIYTKLAATAFALHVVAISSGAQSTGFSGNVKVELLANTGTPGSGYGTDNCPTSNAVIQTVDSSSITGGRSAVSFLAVANAYRDVRVRISYPTTSSTVSICSTDSFAIRPASFTVTSTDATNTATTGTPAIKAGINFNLTADAGVPGGYLGTPVLDTALVRDHNAVAAGTLSGSFAVATGINSIGTFQYHDVGTISLLADAVKDTTFSSIDQTADCVAGSTSNTLSGGQYGCNIGSVASGPFGRFYPDHFIYTATLTPACVIGNFTYMDQSTLGISLTLSAKSANETTTTRYTAGYATLGTLEITGDNGGTLVAVSRLSPVLPAFAWSSGVYTTTGNRAFTRNATPDGPYDSFALKAAVNDPDGAVITGSAISNTSKIRFGRLKLTNVYGSELLNLVMPVQAQYWDGTSFVLNAADSCTALAAANVKLTAAPAGVTASGIGVLSSGKGSLTLTKPSPAVAAEVGVCIDLGADPGTGTVCLATSASSSFLQGLWSPGTNYNNDPIARATFGIYKSNNNFIYQRESY